MFNLITFKIVCIILALIFIIFLIREIVISFRKDKKPWITILWDIAALLTTLTYTYIIALFGFGNFQKTTVFQGILILIILLRYVINEVSKKH